MKIQDDKSLEIYLRDVAETQPLSREEEIELAERIEKGDLIARNRLIEANLRFAVAVAREYEGDGLPLADLISAANLGLMTAADRFDSNRGYKFITYAVWWIRQAIRKALSEEPKTVRIPLNRIESLYRVDKEYRVRSHKYLEKTEQQLREEIAHDLEINPELLWGVDHGTHSLDSYLDQFEEKDTHVGLLRSEEPSPEQYGDEQDLKRLLENAFSSLDEREINVIRRYFGLDGNGNETLEEIAASYKITRERVRQIKDTVLRKLRNPKRAMPLLDYYQER